jgi:cyclomaltodextrinase / maltogenic alpha-amylase / neopullulanase
MKQIILYLFLLIFMNSAISQQFSPPEWSYDKSIYEVNLRQFTPEGTFDAFAEHLPRLKEMGVGILWLMPIHPIGEKNRKGSLGSYYSIKDYFDVNPEHGSKEDFKNLVNRIHELDMYVIIDWVANHTAWDNNWITEKPEWYTKNDKGNMIPPVEDWTDVADLDFSNKDLRAEMSRALRYWVEEFDIDGYRCDVAGMVPTDFWIEARKEVETVKKTFWLAEWDEPELEQAFDMSYSWDQHKLMNKIAAGEANASDMRDYFVKERGKYSADHFRMRFTDNHDENSWNGTVFERLGVKGEMFAVFTTVIPGMPLVYSGQEAGLNRRLEFFEKDVIEWGEHPFYNLYSTLLNHKSNNKALYNGERGGEMVFLSSNHPDDVFALYREKDGDKVLAIFNFSDQELNVNVEGEEIKGSYRNLFTGGEISAGTKLAYIMPANGYYLFTSVK